MVTNWAFFVLVSGPSTVHWTLVLRCQMDWQEGNVLMMTDLIHTSSCFFTRVAMNLLLHISNCSDLTALSCIPEWEVCLIQCFLFLFLFLHNFFLLSTSVFSTAQKLKLYVFSKSFLGLHESGCFLSTTLCLSCIFFLQHEEGGALSPWISLSQAFCWVYWCLHPLL